MSATGMQTVSAALGGRMAYGGDYNPEQWPRETWTEDVALMQEAGVNLVSLAIFSWARLEPRPGHYDFAWLDEIIDLLHEGGVKVDLATATASPPPWWFQAHPDAWLVDVDGVRRSYGARQSYCPSSSAYRESAAGLAAAVVERYAAHPAVIMWHLNNEYGCHNARCYCDTSASDFRRWLTDRYGDVETLNAGWGTAFWSQHYASFDEILPPRAVGYGSFANPTQQLDFARFSSDAVLACFTAEVDAVRAGSDKPLTTNFMGFWPVLDYWEWARHVDLVSNDHYLMADDPAPYEHLALAADLMRSLAGGSAFLMMEQSTSAVNWQPRNTAKAPGQMRRNALTHVARGADGDLYFQWRQSRAGAEKFHSALVPHAGRDSARWREVVALGADLNALAPVVGSQVEPARVAFAFDWDAWWGAELDSHPSTDVSPMAELRRWYHSAWTATVTTDIVHPEADLSAYRVVVLPVTYLLTAASCSALTAFVRSGGTLVVTYFSGIVDENDHAVLGGYPGGLREVLGLSVEEFAPLLAGTSVGLETTPAGAFLEPLGPGTVWSETARVEAASVLATYADGTAAGSPALTVHQFGAGQAFYVGTVLDDAARAALLNRVLADAGVSPVLANPPSGVEAVRRVSQDGHRYLFLLNHAEQEARLPGINGTDLLTGARIDGAVVPARGVLVIDQDRPEEE